ncbi:unnamed protein product [Tilletia controversa]|uniref:Uncharacterized protein n=1 Tax=Tilletia controversa TaxID=13291 RepID=A0A8X7N033_9BASI|nr:hypothetical protein A4X06_0g1142 [Tilletia controversa]CAD6943768.1 unnamed protein product [Tilletia controversa]CAD6984540.1 unnamed protein product [Tilletia controversa]
MDVTPHPPAQSAVARVWNTSELAIEILSYLVREQIDLVTFSTVSKYCRGLALPLLVRYLDVPLTKTPFFVEFFKANPGTVDGIKCMRLRDDSYERPRQPFDLDEVTEQELQNDHWWLQVNLLLELLETNRTKERMPAMDLSVGISNIFKLENAVDRHRKFAERIVALRVVANLPEEPRMDGDPVPWQQFVDRCGSLWRRLGRTVAKICQTSGEQPPALRLFQIEDSLDFQVGHWYIDRIAWDSIREALPATLEDLIIRLGQDEEVEARACTLLQGDWPQLRSFRLGATETGLMDWGRFQAGIDHFLSRHPLLEDVQISAPAGFTPTSLPHTFPNMSVCAIDKTGTAHMGSFLARHIDTLTHLAVQCPELEPDMAVLLPISTTLPKLEYLSASQHISAGFVGRGAKVQHYKIEEVGQPDDLKLNEWLIGREAEKSVRSLDIEFSRVTQDLLDQVLRDLGRILPADAFPNLTELAMCIYGDDGHYVSTDMLQRSLVRALFTGLKNHKSIRAVRMLSPVIETLPPNTVIDLDDGVTIPPQLEYLCWESDSYSQDPQYFRLFAFDRTDHPLLDSSGGRERRQSVRLDVLPASFQSRIDERGVWTQWRNGRPDNTGLFDHPHDSPRLLQ